MASSFSELKFELIATGEQSGTWGSTTNSNVGTAINEAIAKMATVTINGNTTLTWLNTVASQQARNFALKLVPGTVTLPFNLIVPTIQKPYVVINTTSFPATVKTALGTGIVVPSGKSVALYVDGTNVLEQFTFVPSLTVGSFAIEGSSLGMASGGTGNSSISAGIVISNGSALSSTPAPSGALVGTTETQTLSNKTIQQRVEVVSSYGPSPFTPDSDSYDMFVATSQGGTVFDAPIGTPFNGQKMIFRFTFSSSGSLTFATSANGYRAVGVTLPTAAVPGQTLYLGCMWNSLISRWDVLAVNVGA